MSHSPTNRFMPKAVMEHDRIIVFDGICRICCACFGFICRRDKTAVFCFATAQSQSGQDILEWCGLSTDHYETMVYVEKGVVFQRSEAMLEILRRLPQPWPLLSLARFCPRRLRNGIYGLIAGNRYRIFGKRAEAWGQVLVRQAKPERLGRIKAKEVLILK